MSITLPEVDMLKMGQKSKDYSRLSFRDFARGDIRAWEKIWLRRKFAEDRITRLDIAKLIWNYAGLRATLLHRVGYALKRRRVRIIPGIISMMNITLHGFDVPSSVEIGPGLYVPHPVGVVIMARQIGANVTLANSITIGMRNTPEFPLIGDNVFIGAGARILGGIRIGDNAQIGANAVVIKDVPAGAIAVGVPAQIKLPVK
ncbi:DapH/DapD/GlmU-related protein [Candidatus Chlorohelix sp.]|uniref:serine O-acetyltransferase n=1 Tax=Candidatus Chlorohelix sp. TaxID=3139201 RepID=UPI00302E6FE2